MKRQGKYGFTFDNKAEVGRHNHYAELDAVCTQIARPVPLWPIAAFAAAAATLAMVIASVEGWI